MTDPTEELQALDELRMREALRVAAFAASRGEVPVGAVLYGADGARLAASGNRRESDRDPTAHAELIALREGSRRLAAWRLVGATMYVTLEPCPMCAGALVNARVARVVYGCQDPKAGAVHSLFAIGRDPRLNHTFDVRSGVLAEPCAAILKEFFAARRGRA